MFKHKLFLVPLCTLLVFSITSCTLFWAQLDKTTSINKSNRLTEEDVNKNWVITNIPDFLSNDDITFISSSKYGETFDGEPIRATIISAKEGKKYVLSTGYLTPLLRTIDFNEGFTKPAYYPLDINAVYKNNYRNIYQIIVSDNSYIVGNEHKHLRENHNIRIEFKSPDAFILSILPQTDGKHLYSEKEFKVFDVFYREDGKKIADLTGDLQSNTANSHSQERVVQENDDLKENNRSRQEKGRNTNSSSRSTSDAKPKDNTPLILAGTGVVAVILYFVLLFGLN